MSIKPTKPSNVVQGRRPAPALPPSLALDDPVLVSVYADFKRALTDLTFNSKPIINGLTMMAHENCQYSATVVKAIEEHFIEVCPVHLVYLAFSFDIGSMEAACSVSDRLYLQESCASNDQLCGAIFKENGLPFSPRLLVAKG